MSLILRSPYRNDAVPWLRGNLHTHTTNSDGPLSPPDTIKTYVEKGYDFLMISDHDWLTDPAKLDAQGLTLIPGNEITSNGPHVLQIGAKTAVPPDRDRQVVIDQVNAQGGLAVMCHPNWERHYNHCKQETLMALEGYAGIEVFNGVVSWVHGNAYATDRWDQLLSEGRQVWGFATDDCHVPDDLGVGWVMVQSETSDAAAIIEAMRAGAFYASTGVTIESIRTDGATVTIETADAECISVYSDHGFRRMRVDAPKLTFSAPADADYGYIRFECAGFGERRAWSQPIFLDR